MTNKQYKIYKSVVKYQTLPKILNATKIPDYMTLQIEAGPGMLDFSDDLMNDETIVYLTPEATELYEERSRHDWKEIRAWATLAIAGWGAITGTIALFCGRA